MDFSFVGACLTRNLEVGEIRHIPFPIERVLEVSNTNTVENHVVWDIAVLEVELRPATNNAAHIQAHLLRPFLTFLFRAKLGAKVNQAFGARDKVIERSKRSIQNSFGIAWIEVGHVCQTLLSKLHLVQWRSAINHCLNLCHLLIRFQISLLKSEPKASSSANILDSLVKEFAPVIYDGRIIGLKGICGV